MRTKAIIVAVCAALAGACVSDTEAHLWEASQALDDCDLDTAHREFDAAYASDSSHPDAALGFALTDTVMLPEDEEVTAALIDIGFTAPLDGETLLWGPDALLARLRRSESCGSVEDFLETSIPYPPLRDSSIDARDLLRDGLTAQELIDRLSALDDRFERLARAYEMAADAMGEREVIIDGSCGVGRMNVQAPELYAAAAAFVFARAAIAIAPTYDWSFTVADFLHEDDHRRVAALQQFLSVVDAGRANGGRDLLLRGLRLADRGLEAAEAIRAPVADSVFDWSAMDRRVLSDLRLMVGRAIESIEQGQAAMIPYVTPSLSMDVGAYLSSPPDQSSLSGPLWTVEDSGTYTYVQSHGERWQELLRPYFSPDPFDSTTSYRWEIGDRWSGTEIGQVFDPDDRYSRLYSCSR